MISTRMLSDFGLLGNARSATREDIRTAKSKVAPANLEAAYQCGALHVITAAPKRDYSTRITLEPEVDAGGEYLGVVLGWIGNRVYQHAAIFCAATAESTLGLGALRSAFPSRSPGVDLPLIASMC